MIARHYIGIVRALAEREFMASYRGNLLGALSTAVVPVLFLLTYTVIFSTLIPIKLRPEATRTDYAFFLFAGLVGWNLFAETVSQAPRLFESQSHLLRKAHVPITTLPLASALSAYFHSIIWLGVFAVALLLTGRSLHLTLLLAPIALALVGVLAAGASLLLSVVGVFVRDLAKVVGPGLVLAMFLSPILYPVDRLNAVSPWLVFANPVAPAIGVMRGLLLDGALPTSGEMGLASAWGLGSLFLGFTLLRRVKTLLVDLV